MTTKKVLTILFIIYIFTVGYIILVGVENLKCNKITPVYNLNLEDIYNLNNYKSYSYEKTLKERFEKLYNQYLNDKKSNVESFYNSSGKLKDEWRRTFTLNLKKINNIDIRIKNIEDVINLSISEEQKKDFNKLINEKGYHDKLLDMDNFYSKFLPNNICNYIQKTVD